MSRKRSGKLEDLRSEPAQSSSDEPMPTDLLPPDKQEWPAPSSRTAPCLERWLNSLAKARLIPGLLQTHVGPNISPRGKGYTFGGIMQFKDKASLDAYIQHPAHQALLAWLIPLIDAIELDLHA
jgi:stress responsive alpha/beta barrel protein